MAEDKTLAEITENLKKKKYKNKVNEKDEFFYNCGPQLGKVKYTVDKA